VQCGWRTDKYGVSWQAVPVALMEMLSGTDTAASQRAIAVMLRMKKLDIAALRRAYDNA
jgi:predicted 3-demethylubiquinone-9 3-methyltransferase (glyoxalase superfamily)